MKALCFLTFLLVLGAALAQNYTGYQVLKTAPLPKSALSVLRELRHKFFFPGSPMVGNPFTVMASPENLPLLRSTLAALDIDAKTIITDFAEAVEGERLEHQMLKATLAPREPRAAVYDRYMEYEEIDAFVKEVAAANPDLVTLVSLSTTVQVGLHLNAIKISSGPGKKTLFFDCGAQGRDWIAPPVCMRIIEEVLADPELQQAADWYILPIANPEGYLHTWSHDRLWEKNRRSFYEFSNFCYGVYMHRNFGLRWGNDDEFACMYYFKGYSPFSEGESNGVGTYLREIDSMVLYVTFFNSGSVILYPPLYSNVTAPDAPELRAAAEVAAAAIAAVAGTNYTITDDPDNGDLFQYKGNGVDYAHQYCDIPYAFALALPTGGETGFDPAASMIQGVVDETWQGIKALVEHVLAVTANE